MNFLKVESTHVAFETRLCPGCVMALIVHGTKAIEELHNLDWVGTESVCEECGKTVEVKVTP